MSEKTSLKTVNAAIALCVKSGASFYASLEKAIALCVAHASEYHDVTVFGKLINGLTENVPGFAANSLVQYIKAQCPVEFEYSADKKSIENVKELKDKDGNLKKAYPTEEILAKVPFSGDKDMQRRTTQEIVPISYNWFKERIASLETQLDKAIKKDGRGILGGMKGDKPVVLHEGDKGFDEVYAPLKNYIHGLSTTAANLIPMLKKGMPGAETEAAAQGSAPVPGALTSAQRMQHKPRKADPLKSQVKVESKQAAAG